MAEGVPAPGKAELDKAAWVVKAHLADDCVDGDKIEDDAVDSEHLAAGAIDPEHLADDAVTAAKADTFLSGLITRVAAAASPEVHGLGASPSMFFAMLQELSGLAGSNISASADATSVWVTASPSVKYIIFAWL